MVIREYIGRFGRSGVGFAQTVSQFPKTDLRYIKWRKSLLRRTTPWNKGLTKETHPSVAKISKTLQEKKIDNFANWRQKARREGLLPRSYPPLKKNEKFAFLVGLILGDGHLAKYPRTESLRITLGTDKPDLWQYAVRVIWDLFRKRPNVRRRKLANCLDIDLYQNCLSERLGVPLGGKQQLPLIIPQWIWEDRRLLIACLKGLFEAEGSLSIHSQSYTYNFQFKNSNTYLLKEVRRALILLGLHPESRSNAIRLRRKREVLFFEQLINFRKFDKIQAYDYSIVTDSGVG